MMQSIIMLRIMTMLNVQVLHQSTTVYFCYQVMSAIASLGNWTWPGQSLLLWLQSKEHGRSLEGFQRILQKETAERKLCGHVYLEM